MWTDEARAASAAARAGKHELTKLGRRTMAGVAHQNSVNRVPSNYSGLTALGRRTLASKGPAATNYPQYHDYSNAADQMRTYGVPIAAGFRV